ncbi:S24 family peptidase [Vibrio sinaloensis]|uniref:S24 family peptidase n=1 Tax=Photobacterium sp. (strain ATCC 43367) TaxID=379097 RepID=UPI002F41AEDB
MVIKEWFTSIELSKLSTMPNSRQAVTTKANRNKWLKRRAVSTGNSFEYHISSFHPDSQKEIIETSFTNKDDLEKAKEIIRTANYSDLNPNDHLEKNVSKVQPIPEFSSWVDLPVFDVYAAAGARSLINSEYQIASLSIPSELITGTGLDPKLSAIIFVNGDSMAPTIDDGDRVLIDLREFPHPVKNGVYVIRIDESVYVKRLNWDIAKGVYNIISDNPQYPTFEINHNNGRNFKIIGKVATVVMKTVS